MNVTSSPVARVNWVERDWEYGTKYLRVIVSNERKSKVICRPRNTFKPSEKIDSDVINHYCAINNVDQTVWWIDGITNSERIQFRLTKRLFRDRENTELDWRGMLSDHVTELPRKWKIPALSTSQRSTYFKLRI